jgi:tryptophan halogenase
VINKFLAQIPSEHILNRPVKKIVIAGGGTAGWIAAALLGKTLGKTHEIVLIESDDIPTVGVGEATIPPLIKLHQILEIDEREFMSAVDGTFKLGIQFENWRERDHRYIHSFGYAGQDVWACSFIHFWLAGLAKGIDHAYADYCVELLAAQEGKFAVLPRNRINYAYHMDAGRYASFLRSYSEKHGVTRIEGKIEAVNVDPSNGYIESLTLKSGALLSGDFFIDCTGFRALLIEGALHSGYDDWSHWLPCDSAIAVQTESVGEPVPYTRSIAHEWGWQWRIPLQSRVGNGVVYSSRHVSDEEAGAKLLSNVEGETINQPKPIKFRTGTRRKHWKKNCLALGLASGFLEPLESTSIHLIQRSMIRFLQLFPTNGVQQVDIDEFNNQNQLEVERIRDFIILHYKVTNREDSPFWQYCKNMDIPPALQQKIDLFAETGRVFKIENELFGVESWMQVMMGQGVMPDSYHPVADAMGEAHLDDFLRKIREDTARLVEKLPSHQEFINYYCRAKT